MQPGSGSFDNATNAVLGKAGAIKPGIYGLSSAVEADKKQTYSGQILHADYDSFYQKIGTKIIKHQRDNFDIKPEIGSFVSISYSANGKVESTAAQEQGRGLKR